MSARQVESRQVSELEDDGAIDADTTDAEAVPSTALARLSQDEPALVLAQQLDDALNKLQALTGDQWLLQVVDDKMLAKLSGDGWELAKILEGAAPKKGVSTGHRFLMRKRPGDGAEVTALKAALAAEKRIIEAQARAAVRQAEEMAAVATTNAEETQVEWDALTARFAAAVEEGVEASPRYAKVLAEAKKEREEGAKILASAKHEIETMDMEHGCRDPAHKDFKKALKDANAMIGKLQAENTEMRNRAR